MRATDPVRFRAPGGRPLAGRMPGIEADGTSKGCRDSPDRGLRGWPLAGRGRFRNRLRQAGAVSPDPTGASPRGGGGEEDAGTGFGVREGVVVVWWSRRAQPRDGPRGRVPPSPWRRGRSATSRTPRPHHLLQGSAVAHGPGQAAPLPDAEQVHTAPRPVHRFRSDRFGRPAERTPTPRLTPSLRRRSSGTLRCRWPPFAPMTPDPSSPNIARRHKHEARLPSYITSDSIVAIPFPSLHFSVL